MAEQSRQNVPDRVELVKGGSVLSSLEDTVEKSPPPPKTALKGPSAHFGGVSDGATLQFSPQEVYFTLVDSGVKKMDQGWLERTIQGISAGVWIGLVGHVCVAASVGMSQMTHFAESLAYGLYFPIALIAIMVTGADLFTSNTMTLTLAWLQRRCKWWQPLLSGVFSFFANATGTVLVGFLISWLGNGFGTPESKERLFYMAEKKVARDYHESFLMAVACNMFVCAAVVLYSGYKDGAARFIVTWFSIGAFVVAGFEHVIANFYTIPTAMMYGADVSVFDFFIRSTLMVCLGNSFSGSILMAVPAWALHRKAYDEAFQKLQHEALLVENDNV